MSIQTSQTNKIRFDTSRYRTLLLPNSPNTIKEKIFVCELWCITKSITHIDQTF